MTTSALLIRLYDARDAGAFRQCVVELQEAERAIDARLRPGEAMADGYCAHIFARCRAADGHVFVAEVDGSVVGFVAVMTREPFTKLDEPPGTYAYVSDLAVLATHRQRGIGRQLLARAEACARDAGATQLRIGVLAENASARQLYLSADFTPLLEILEKRWSA